ncbi:uncharacterized protein LOC141543869 isoform X2 [Sminthopsis crassicaudata]|uniref:uncharacterized protein LOC141543869 isoform X1 n=1 Tax=Sminthopsis crassicaudata TaxID=9301 RepID=UPI003D691BD2
MMKRNGVFPQDFVQDQHKSLLGKAKSLIFRGPPHGMQGLDFEGQKHGIPGRPKMEAKDVGGPSWVRSSSYTTPNNTILFPSIVMEPLLPVTPECLPKATPAYPGQAVNAVPKRTFKIHLATECQTLSETGLERSSVWSQGESSAAKEAAPKCDNKKISRFWKTTAKVSPTLLSESKLCPRDLSGPSLNLAQGEGPPTHAATPKCGMQKFSSLWRKTAKVFPALLSELETSSRDLDDPSFNWAQGEGPPPQAASPVRAIKVVRTLGKRSTKSSPGLPTVANTFSSILSSQGPQGEIPQAEEGIRACAIKGVSELRKRMAKVSPALPNVSKTPHKVVSKPCDVWLQDEDLPLQEALQVKGFSAPRNRKTTTVNPRPPIGSKTFPTVVSDRSSNWPQGEAASGQEATPFCGIKVIITGIKKCTEGSPGLPSESKALREIIFQSSCNWTQEENAGTQIATPACPPQTSGPWEGSVKVQLTSSPRSQPSPSLVTKNSEQRPQEIGCGKHSAFGAFLENLQIGGLTEAHRALLISPRKRNKSANEQK